MTPVSAEAFDDLREAVSNCGREMSENAIFIENELPKVEMPDALRATTEEVCAQLIAVRRGLGSEMGEVHELFRAQAGETEITSRVDSIVARMRQPIEQMHELVMSLDAAGKEDVNYVLGSVLVTESAAHILAAFGAVQETADKVCGRASQSPRTGPG